MYAVYDTVAAVFFKPFTEVNDATAVRCFTQSLEGHPSARDYELFRVGSFDDSVGALEPCDLVKIFSGFTLAASAASADISEEENEK